MPSIRLVSASLVLVLGASVTSAALQFGQAGSPRPGSPPGSIPPTFPTDSHPSSSMPPDTSAPPATERSNPATESSNSKIAGQITTAISGERRLQKDNVNVEVTEATVMLSGHVADNNHRYLALRIAHDHAGTRSLVDRLRMGDEQ